MIWSEARQLHPVLPKTSDGWHQHTNGGGWVRNGVYVGENAYVDEAAVLFGGVFRGGEFFGGVFRGGEFLGGEFLGGEFLGGAFFGGAFFGGAFRGGVFRGGVFRGGEFCGGEFRVGVFCGGVFRGAGVLLVGVLPWIINTAGFEMLAIGCECHSLNDWEQRLPAIVRKHNAQEHEATIRDMVLPLVRNWFAQHPDVIQRET